MSSRHVSQKTALPPIPPSSYQGGAHASPGCSLDHNDPQVYSPPDGGTQVIQQSEAPERARPRSCGLMMKDRGIRLKLYRLIVSTVFLLINFAICLCFFVIGGLQSPWVYNVLVAILICLGVIWCHALIRLIMAVYKFPYRNSSTEHGMLRIRMGRAAGYAQPSKPIQVTMVGDEEQLSETHSAASVKVMMPPPAYGRWRGSIRLNPDLLFWQRIDNQSSVLQSNARGQEDAASKTGEPQPPSYLPNMGVNHVAEAKPRPVTEYPQG